MGAPQGTFPYRAHRPVDSLRQSIEISRPDLIVPCDDRAVRRLHQLHTNASRAASPRDSAWIVALIERSLGTPASFPILRRRDSLAALAALQDVQAPRIDSIQTVSDFRRWIAEHGLPAMLKLDGTSGGEDIVPVYDPAKLGRAFLVMQLRCAGLGRLKRARRNRDVHLPFAISTMARQASQSRPMCGAGLRIVRSPAGAATYLPPRRSRPYAFKRLWAPPA